MQALSANTPRLPHNRMAYWDLSCTPSRKASQTHLRGAGLGSLLSLGKVLLCVYLTCIVFVVFGFGLAARLSGFSLWKFLKFIRDEIFTVAGALMTPLIFR
jgi:hypothetical protein